MTITDSRRGTAALAGVEVWIFDLDNTLYPASCDLFSQVDRRIGEFIATHFDLSPLEARRRQKQYFREYGTTLRGLMVEHDLEPHRFLDYVHDIDVSPVAPDPVLDRILAALPGRKLIYTNGSIGHAEAVVARLGISSRFEAIHDIVAADFLPKPDPRPYAALVERYRIDPARACMVEDIARNLVPAAALGMTTVWLRGDLPWTEPDPGAAPIDHIIEELNGWLAEVAAGQPTV